MIMFFEALLAGIHFLSVLSAFIDKIVVKLLFSLEFRNSLLVSVNKGRVMK